MNIKKFLTIVESTIGVGGINQKKEKEVIKYKEKNLEKEINYYNGDFKIMKKMRKNQEEKGIELPSPI